jgi:phosphatidylserine/phosphatidylglycerophosphate/cardiolipin synthase-like enzyme
VETQGTSATDSMAWWASDDMPVRAGCEALPLVDGHAAMLAMCRSFLSATQYILLAGWDIHVELPMVRGEDVRLGADDSPGQRDLLVGLRQEGLDDEALALWNANKLRVVDVLGFAARRGVRVGVLLWDAYHFGSHITNDPAKQRDVLAAVGVECLLDDSSRDVHHLTQSLHQKCCVVDGRVAYVGGVDLTVQDGGDYDRWDTHGHACSSPERVTERRAAAHPWHDVHVRLRGPVVADVQRNIAQRWTEVARRHSAPDWPSALAPEAVPVVSSGSSSRAAQIVRTIPPRTYAFAPSGIATIKQLYLRALSQARRYVYFENQYLWPEVFRGLDTLSWGGKSQDILDVLEAMGGALARGVHIAITLPDHPNCGRRFTDGGIEWLRARAAAVGAADSFSVFTLGSCEPDDTLDGGIFYRPVYTHAKVAIVDDVFWTAGSANLNSRGMATDAEINVGVLDPDTARTLRLTLWREHTHASTTLHSFLGDPIEGLRALRELAIANRERVRRREALQGHLLPYLTASDASPLDLPVHFEHGWLDNLSGGAGPLPAHRAGRYI